MGISILKFWSNVRDIVIQYKLDVKYPKPNIHPFKKYSVLLNVNFFFMIKRNNAGNVKKLIKKISYGGRLNELNIPKQR